MLNKINNVQSIAISRGVDNEGHYGEGAVNSVTTMKRMDADLQTLNQNGVIDSDLEISAWSDLKLTVNQKLEDLGLVHADLRPNNILVNQKANGEFEF